MDWPSSWRVPSEQGALVHVETVAAGTEVFCQQGEVLFIQVVVPVSELKFPGRRKEQG